MDLVGPVAFALLFSMGMALLFRSTEAAPREEQGTFVLRYPHALAVFGWMVLGLGTVLIGVMANRLGIHAAEGVLSLGGLVAFFGAASAFLLGSYRREWVRLSLDAIDGRGVLARRPVRIRWEEVERVQFSGFTGWLTLRAGDGRRVRASALLVGSSHLADLIERRLPRRGGPEAARRLRNYRAGHLGIPSG